MRTDPIELEIFKNLFVSVAEEMGVTLCRTGFSPNIKERLDFSCALYDRHGHTVAQGDHLPVHLGAMPLSVRAAIDHVAMAPGDIVLLNDPFRGGTHLPDLTLVSPVFLPGPHRKSAPTQVPVFFVANRAHHSDVGGMSPGSMPLAREIFQEGLILPPVRLVKAGRIDPDLLALILANVRTPEEREGDLTAQIAANHVGASRLLHMVSRFGLRKVEHYAAAAQDYAERVLRRTIAAIPDGSYTFADALEDDGFSPKPTPDPIPIRCTLTVAADHATVDFTGSAPQTTGGVNANLAITLSATLYCFRCLVTDDVLYNDGIRRAVTVIAPEGSIVNARHPSAVAGGNVECSQRITDVVLGALAQALPHRIPAASQGTMNNVTLGGLDTRPAITVRVPHSSPQAMSGVQESRPDNTPNPTTHPRPAVTVRVPHSSPQAMSGVQESRPDNTPNPTTHPRPFAYYETAGGGMGGRPGAPGLSGVHTHMSNTRNTPIEALEQALPLRITTYALRPHTGGAGQFPGGDGLLREYELLVPTTATLLTERRRSAPYGAQGGQPGAPGRNTLLRADGTTQTLPAKITLDLSPGDRLRLETPGGGGYGPAPDPTPSPSSQKQPGKNGQ